MDAWEEAGVAGKAKKRALGYFTCLKTLDDGHKTASAVEVFRLKVDELHHEFPEHGERQVAWLSPVEAASVRRSRNCKVIDANTQRIAQPDFHAGDLEF